jgi:hypothetical protein
MPSSVPLKPVVLGGIAAVLIPFILYAGILVHGYNGKHYIRGDTVFYYLAAVMLWRTGDIEFAKLAGPNAPLPIFFCSLEKHGRLVSKHPVLMPLVASPLIGAFGYPGALAFNQLQMAALLLMVYVLALRGASPWAAATATVLTGVGTFLPHHVWNFSADVFTAVLLLAGLVCLPAKPAVSRLALARYALAGLFFGLSFYTKMAMAVAIPFVVLLIGRPFWRSAIAFGAGLAVALAAYGLLNQHLFGSPLVCSYDRVVQLVNEQIVIGSERSLLGFAGFFDHFRGLLLHEEVGLLPTTPLTVLAFLALPLLSRRNRALAWYVGLSSLAIFLFFCCWEQWYSSGYGNRFLIVPVTLGALPLAAALEAVFHRLRGGKQSRAAIPEQP